MSAPASPDPDRPDPDRPDPDRPIGWGILGPGRIAASFAADLALLDDARLVAVGSRSAQRAEAFVSDHLERHGRDDVPAPTAHGSYAGLLADDAVDVVYVASPHALHLEHARAAFEAGKHVLCEKPLTLRADDAAEMVRLAREHDRFLMEAMWTACHPVVRAVLDALATGDLGTPRQVRGELGFKVVTAEDDRLLDPALGAGALLDMGIYPLTWAHLVLGEPESLTGSAVLAPSGIDLDVAVTGRYPGGAVAAMTASMTSWSDRTGAVATDRGRVELEGSFHHPDAAWFVPFADGATNDDDGTTAPRRLEPTEPVVGRGYGNEAAEVDRCLRAGLRESPLVPHAQTLSVMRQLDEVRRQTGIRYPDD